MPPLDVGTIGPALENFLGPLLRTGRFDLRFRIEPGLPESGADVVVQFKGSDVDVLLQRGGELLLALEHVAAKALRLSTDEQSRLSFDCQDFKMLRDAELRLTAVTAAERVEHTGTPFALNPMNARERRIVHLALRDRPGVRTESEGSSAQRRVIIHPQK